jgi:uridine kinase
MRIIGITGASGSGKSSIARALQHALASDGQAPQLSILPVDA